MSSESRTSFGVTNFVGDLLAFSLLFLFKGALKIQIIIGASKSLRA